MKLFAGTNNVTLTQKIASELGLPLANAEVIRFDNSEVRVHIEEEVKGETCVVVQSTSNPADTNLMELFFYCDALKRKEAAMVIAVIPFFGYARQSIAHRAGECVSVNVIVKFLETIGFDKVYTIDLHDRATEGVFSIPFKHISAVEILAHEAESLLKKQGVKEITPKNVAIVSPDQGAIVNARKFGEALFGKQDFSLSVIEKRRNYTDVHVSVSLGLYGSVKDKMAIIVDDMVTSGGTLIQASKLCLEDGAMQVFACTTHPDFGAHAVEKINDSPISHLIVSDTIDPIHMKKSDKISFVSVAKLCADELRYLL